MKLTKQKLETHFRIHIEKACGPVDVCGFHFNAADVLEKMDPQSYKDEFENWITQEIVDGQLVELASGLYAFVNPSNNPPSEPH